LLGLPVHEIEERFGGDEICSLLNHLQEEPDFGLILDRQLSRISATLLSIFGQSCQEDALWMTRRLPPLTEEEEAMNLLNLVKSVGS
jgi:hypothetical protein